jgi:hypothetical protein
MRPQRRAEVVEAVLGKALVEAEGVVESLRYALAELANDEITPRMRENAVAGWTTRARRLAGQCAHTLSGGIP